jgi:predicted ribosome quality control (RQC) complex YloA/Tae2 family protein
VKNVREELLGKRLANVYDLSERTYLFKFAGQSSTEKAMLLLDSGTRFHLTNYVRNVPDLPSPFAMKLRKHIRTKRLEGINQLGYDRVVDFKFGSGEAVNHILLELYSGGNVVLTDANYEVIALLRSHQFSEDVVLKVGEIYPVASATNLETQINSTSITGPCENVTNFRNWIESRKAIQNDSTVVAGTEKEKEKTNAKKSKGLNLKQLLVTKESGISHLGPEIIEHCLLDAGIKQNAKMDLVKQLSDEQISSLLSTLKEKGIALLDSLDSPTPQTPVPESDTTGSNGFIIFEKNNPTNYNEFTPILLNQHKDFQVQEFSTFSQAVDEYFYKIEDQKMVKELHSREETAKKKIAKVQEDQEKLIGNLNEQKRQLEKGAMLLEIHAGEVDTIRTILNNWIENELPWKVIQEQIDDFKQKSKNIFLLIANLLSNIIFNIFFFILKIIQLLSLSLD